MKQLLQNVSTGEITVEDVPAPLRRPGMLLVATRYSLISAGTERAVLKIGRSSLVGKARARPDLARKVVENVRAEGVAATYEKVRGRLEEPNALGYSLSGVVLESCEDGPAAPGELVACAGAGYASHAEVVAVPKLLCARVPDGVAPADAAYATVAAIALHGVRLARVGLGDVVAVVGLGLVGQLTLELVAAAGAVPLGVDPSPDRVKLAQAEGFFATCEAGDLTLEAGRLTAGRGADGVLVTAASRGSEPLTTAISVARERAIVCVVGDVAIESPRAPLFAKELQLVVSRSYGPGRYDPSYEESGVDYPPGYVRWTEGRNLEEVLRLMAAGRLRPARLTTHTFDVADGAAAYELLEARESSLGILLRYEERVDPGPRLIPVPVAASSVPRTGVGNQVRIGVIGAGAFALGVLLPALKARARITAVATTTGLSARAAASRFGARLAATEVQEVLEADDVDAVVIATRHDSHAELTARALEAGKHVFVEKPLAIDAEGLARVEAAVASSPGVLMVGFNRRFAPLSTELRAALGGRGPLIVTYRVNAGRISRDHWTRDLAVGGGRIVGEACHFVDYACWLTDAIPNQVIASAIAGAADVREDSVLIALAFPDGSLASIVYSALGDASLSKERVEVLANGRAGVIDDFRSLSLHLGGRRKTRRGRRDKGHDAELAAFVEACRSGIQPWPIGQMAAVTRTTFAVRDQILGLVPPS